MGAGITRIKAGQAFIELTADHEKFMKGVDRIQSRMRRFAGNINRIGRNLTIGGGAITGAFIPFLSTVADAETAMRRFQLIFGNAAGVMREQLKAISAETGVALTPLIEQSSSFAAIFGQLQDVVGGADFARLIGNVQRQVLNLSALAGITLPEAAARMRSAFTSTGESVDQFGLNLRQAEVNAEAQRLGLNKNVRQMSEMEKQLIKLSIVQRSMDSMNIEFIDMVDTLNGQLTILRSNFRELAVVAGEDVRKALVDALRSANIFLVDIRDMTKELGPTLTRLLKFGAGMLAVGLSLQGFALAWRGLAWALGPALAALRWLAMGNLGIAIVNLASNIDKFTASLVALRGAAMSMRGGIHTLALGLGLGLAEKKPQGTMNVPADQHNLVTFWRAFREELYAARAGEREEITQRLGPGEEGAGPSPSDATPGRGAAEGVGEARGTFQGALISQQMAFGTTAGSGAALASIGEEILELFRQILDEGGPGGTKVKTSGVAS